jgi:hypothetical protein
MRMTTAINDVSAKTFLREIAKARRFQVLRVRMTVTPTRPVPEAGRPTGTRA